MKNSINGKYNTADLMYIKTLNVITYAKMGMNVLSVLICVHLCQTGRRVSYLFLCLRDCLHHGRLARCPGWTSVQTSLMKWREGDKTGREED